MAFFTAIMFVVDRIRGEWIGAGLFFTLAMIFFLVYLSKHANWAAIVAFVMFVLSFLPLLAMTTRPEISGVLFFLAISLPFLFIYFRSAEHWWAIIPAGIMLTMAILIAIILLTGTPSTGLDPHIANAIIFAGMAFTFAIVGLRHHRSWALMLAVLVVLIAIMATFIHNPSNSWALFVVATGICLIYNALRPRIA
jgi:hypothetical protein